MTIWPQKSNRPVTHSCGGGTTERYILIYHGWRWIISVFPVCFRTIRSILTILNMADIFILLATSTAVERIFSQGRQLLHFTRNRLTGASVRKFLCLGAWGRKDLISVEDILSVIKSRKKRAREPVEDIEEEQDDAGEPPAKRARAK